MKHTTLPLPLRESTPVSELRIEGPGIYPYLTVMP